MYKIILDEGIVIRNSDEVIVAPCQSDDDPNYLEYVAWIHAGNEAESVITRGQAVIKIPDVTPRQIRMALLGVGVTEAMIDSIINSLPSPTKEAAMIAWKYSTAFQRNNALIPIVAQMLNYSSQQLDDLWLYAGTL
jgi:hypothetical protein